MRRLYIFLRATFFIVWDVFVEGGRKVVWKVFYMFTKTSAVLCSWCDAYLVLSLGLFWPWLVNLSAAEMNLSLDNRPTTHTLT